MIILSVDVESTGLNIDVDEIVEIGMVVYDTTHSQVVAMHSDILKTTKWSNEAEVIHKIKRDVSNNGYSCEFNPWKLVEHYKPVVIVAHNKDYDKGLITKRWPEFLSLPWICTKNDLPHEKIVGNVNSTRLQHLAVDYGVDSGRRHRALWDALTCCELAAKHNLEHAMKIMNEPRCKVEAWFSGKPNFDDADFNLQKEFLKKAGFKWIERKWIKDNVPESLVDKYVALATSKNGWQAKYIKCL
jgi:DNA polymerase III epsilon subunit-like protein